MRFLQALKFMFLGFDTTSYSKNNDDDYDEVLITDAKLFVLNEKKDAEKKFDNYYSDKVIISTSWCLVSILVIIVIFAIYVINTDNEIPCFLEHIIELACLPISALFGILVTSLRLPGYLVKHILKSNE